MSIKDAKVGVKKVEPGSFYWCSIPVQKEMNRNWKTWSFLWTWVNTSVVCRWQNNTGTVCPGAEYLPWRCSEATWKWTWSPAPIVPLRASVGLDDKRSLPIFLAFNHSSTVKNFCIWKIMFHFSLSLCVVMLQATLHRHSTLFFCLVGVFLLVCLLFFWYAKWYTHHKILLI